jgi:hypothetical protein
LEVALDMHCEFFLKFGFVASKLVPFVEHTLVAWVGLCFAIDGKHVIPPEICSKEGYLHLRLQCNSECMLGSIVQITL